MSKVEKSCNESRGMSKVEESFSENKDADQLRNFCEADLCNC